MQKIWQAKLESGKRGITLMKLYIRTEFKSWNIQFLSLGLSVSVSVCLSLYIQKQMSACLSLSIQKQTFFKFNLSLCYISTYEGLPIILGTYAFDVITVI